MPSLFVTERCREVYARTRGCFGTRRVPAEFLYRIVLAIRPLGLVRSCLESADREAAPGANPFAVSPVLEFTAAAIGRLCLGPPYSRPCDRGQCTPLSSERIVGLSPAARLTF